MPPLGEACEACVVAVMNPDVASSQIRTPGPDCDQVLACAQSAQLAIDPLELLPVQHTPCTLVRLADVDSQTRGALRITFESVGPTPCLRTYRFPPINAWGYPGQSNGSPTGFALLVHRLCCRSCPRTKRRTSFPSTAVCVETSSI